MLSCVDTLLERDRQTDGQRIPASISHFSIAVLMHDKNCKILMNLVDFSTFGMEMDDSHMTKFENF